MNDECCGECRFLGLNKNNYLLDFGNVQYSMRNNKIVCNKSGLIITDSCERIDKCKDEKWKV